MCEVKVEQGVLQGRHCEGLGETYESFKGIPFAKPPIGQLRFKAPEPPESWVGVRDAGEHGPVCPQFNERENRIDEGSEDCLYLNVFTKSVTPTTLRPVMVWIHGGAFYTGSGNTDFYGPDFLVAEDVVLVTFNYRLEVLGFLCLDTEEVPGNAGLKDQAFALRWVKRNIAVFGGDPDNVTIFGCSAGSASVSYHMLSELSRGLFHKAICQSGVCLNDWSYGLYARQRAVQLAKQLGKDTEDVDEILQFLRNIPVMSLVRIQLPKITTDLSDSILFGPVTEKSFPGSSAFMCEPSLDVLRRCEFSKTPLMIGYNSGEGIEIARYLKLMQQERNQNVEINVPRELKMKWTPERIQTEGERIKRFYFSEKPISMETIDELVMLDTDLHFSYNIIRFAKLVSRCSSVFFYKFSCDTERNHMKRQYEMEGVKGVCHGDELPYLFNISSLALTLDESQTCEIVKRVVRLWTNFASSSDPTASGDLDVTWERFDETAQNYLVIDDTLQLALDPDSERIRFWDQIYEVSDCRCTKL